MTDERVRDWSRLRLRAAFVVLTGFVLPFSVFLAVRIDATEYPQLEVEARDTMIAVVV